MLIVAVVCFIELVITALSALPNWLKLLNGSLGKSNIDHMLNVCLVQLGKNQIYQSFVFCF